MLCGGCTKHLQITKHPLRSTRGPPSDPVPPPAAGSVGNTRTVGNTEVFYAIVMVMVPQFPNFLHAEKEMG